MKTIIVLLTIITTISSLYAGDNDIRLSVGGSPGLRWLQTESVLYEDSQWNTYISNGRNAWKYGVSGYGNPLESRGAYIQRGPDPSGTQILIYDDVIGTKFPYFNGSVIQGAYGNSFFLRLEAVSTKRDSAGNLIPFTLNGIRIKVTSKDDRIGGAWNAEFEDLATDGRVRNAICAISLGADGVFGGRGLRYAADDVLTTDTTVPIVGYLSFANIGLTFNGTEEGSNRQQNVIDYLDWWTQNRGGFTFEVEFSVTDVNNCTSHFHQDFKVLDRAPSFVWSRKDRCFITRDVTKPTSGFSIGVATNSLQYYVLQKSTDLRNWTDENQALLGGSNYTQLFRPTATTRSLYWRVRAETWNSSHLRTQAVQLRLRKPLDPDVLPEIPPVDPL